MIEISKSEIVVNPDNTITTGCNLDPCGPSRNLSLREAISLAEEYAMSDSGHIFSVWDDNELICEFYNKAHYRLQKY